MSSINNLSEYEGSAFRVPVSSSVIPRWQRKALERRARDTPNKTPRQSPMPDRFIPARSAMNLDLGHFQLTKDDSPVREGSCVDEEYRDTLKANLLNDEEEENNRILAFKGKAPAPREGYQNSTRVLYSGNRPANPALPERPKARHIPQQAERVLDAPELLDDYYLNLLSWSTNNVLAVALGHSVYLWNATTGATEELCHCQEADDYITSVSWVEEGSYLAVGTASSQVQLWDADATRQVRSMRGHTARVSSLAWNNHILSSGGRDSIIFNHDVRVADHIVATLRGHEQEVCGLSWSPDGSQLASGGNDNLLCIWDAHTSSTTESPKFLLDQHTAAVKALAWCPFQRNVLASGGGTADRCIKFWNTQNGACLNSVDTNSQVCALVWSKTEKELISSHGFSQNQLCLWKYPSMVKVGELNGHTARVLHLALSPDGTTVGSAAADETLRFWRVWECPNNKKKTTDSSNRLMSSLNIR